MKVADRKKVERILTDTITTEPTDWCVIRDTVAKEVKVTNWMGVRGILWSMVQAGKVRRLDNVYREEYVKV